MLHTIKRLALGISLIALTSAILLYADRGRRTGATATTTGARVHRIAILQHANTVVLDEGVRGVVDALAERGYRDGERMAITHLNAQGDMPTGIAMAQQVTGGGYDLVVTSSTPSMQALANNNKEGKVKHVFTLVADPWASGVGLVRGNPLAHPPHMAGHGSFPPVDTAFELARKMLPGLKRIGTAWNPAETNSRVFVEKGREVAKAMGLELLEANVDSTAALTDSINSLISRNAQAIWVGGDNTVIAGINTVIAQAGRSGIPVFTILPGTPDRGTLFDAGPDFYAVGRQSGLMAADVLEGADMTKMEIRDVLDVIPPFLSVNTKALKGLKERWQVPADVLAQATVVVDETGTHRKGKPAAAAASTPRPLTKQWRVSLVQMQRLIDVEEAERGVLDGLREAGLVEGRDYVKSVRDAQGDMAAIIGLIDTAVAEGADMLITFSTPTLQAAVQRAKKIPVIFNYVGDPIAAGAGTSDTTHAPNVTGVYLIAAYDQMLPLLRAYLPNVKVVGTVYTPAEVNMVSQLARMNAVFPPAGIQVKTVAANSPSDVGEAALALIAGQVEAIVQIPGNLTAAAFPSISSVARRARVPIFGFQSVQVMGGAVAAVSRDYYDSGREAARLAARVMRGESPGAIPFVPFSENRLLVNVEAAKALGMATPGAILAKAEQVLGK